MPNIQKDELDEEFDNSPKEIIQESSTNSSDNKKQFKFLIKLLQLL